MSIACVRSFGVNAVLTIKLNSVTYLRSDVVACDAEWRQWMMSLMATYTKIDVTNIDLRCLFSWIGELMQCILHLNFVRLDSHITDDGVYLRVKSAGSNEGLSSWCGWTVGLYEIAQIVLSCSMWVRSPCSPSISLAVVLSFGIHIRSIFEFQTDFIGVC